MISLFRTLAVIFIFIFDLSYFLFIPPPFQHAVLTSTYLRGKQS